MHAAFAVGVLTEILNDVEQNDRFEVIGLSGTSAGALCAVMTWYGLAPKKNAAGSPQEAVHKLNRFWDDFVASPGPETLLNYFTFGLMKAEELEIPVLGISAPVFGFNPAGAISRLAAYSLPSLGVRKEYFELVDTLMNACPDFANIDWPKVTARVLVGASEVVQGFETVFDSDVNKGIQPPNHGRELGKPNDYWHQRLPLTFSGVGRRERCPCLVSLNVFTAVIIGMAFNWQNPPVRDFFAGAPHERIPDELWIIRITRNNGRGRPNSTKKS